MDAPRCTAQRSSPPHETEPQRKASGVQGAAMSPLVARDKKPPSALHQPEGETNHGQFHPQIPLRTPFCWGVLMQWINAAASTM